MPVSHLPFDALAAWIRGLPVDGGAPAGGGGGIVVVDLDTAAGPAPELHTGVVAVVVGLTTAAVPHEHPAAAACDVALHPGDDALGALVAAVEAHPIAATSLALLLRGAAHRSVDDGLAAESAVYSVLQAGPEFATWRASRPRRVRTDDAEPIRLERHGAELGITLQRPHVHNALNTAMRDRLVDAFGLVALDPTITEVHLRGAGPSFCAGGDLDEFGSFREPASAHLVRLQRSAGRAIAAVGERVTAHLHGACVGSGIELPAFAAHVVADPSTLISLPEVSLGLVPGAGGTVSLPRRIGRHRTARLALTGERLDAHTARAWGLVDTVEDLSGSVQVG